MGFGDWYVRRGRIDQRTWWLHYTLPYLVLCTVAGIADSSIGFPPPASEGWSVFTYLGGPLTIAMLLLTGVPSISSTVARLHDRGRSAWWLLWMLLPVVGWLVLLVENGFRAGDAGPNAYGKPPAASLLVYA